jgi:hypothetical protein
VNRQLHIVCLDVPWPPDYGGVIDMMNRIMAFKRMGVGIHLHYFSYNERGTPPELNEYCQTVNVYQREKPGKSLSFHLPYIVASRINRELITRLEADDHPILLEGIHCTGILKEMDIKQRKIVVRMHNEESVYYKELARAEQGWFKKLYFYNESRLLKKYSHHLPNECVYACVSQKDIDVLKNEYHLEKVEFLPTFPAWQTVCSQEGLGNFCLYHGNLSVPENEEAVAWLICNVFTKARVPFIVAGKKPTKKLQRIAGLCQHTCLVANPSQKEMNDLVRKAHIHTLPCFNKGITGIRLKLLHALFEGRHCVVNEPMVAGTGLEEACHIGSNANAFASIIMQLHNHPYTKEETILRKQLLGDTYNNDRNTQKLSQWLW